MLMARKSAVRAKKPGDDVLIRIVEADGADEPSSEVAYTADDDRRQERLILSKCERNSRIDLDSMRVAILLLIFVNAFAVGVKSQTAQADTDPVLQGSANYKLPQSAIDAEIDGKVTVAVHVDKTGKPTKAVLVSGLVWPCGKMPAKAIEDVSSTLADTIMALKFSPAMKDGKPASKDFGLSFAIKNPKLDPVPVEKNPVTGKPKARQIIGGVLNGKATFLPKPSYSAEARARRIGGAVPIQVMFDESGNVVRAGALGGHPALQFGARESACGAKFEPVTLEGKPIKVSGVITYNFVPM